MDGPDAARTFRAWELEHVSPAAPRLPVFCLTANVLEEHRVQCADAGMDGFITKPLRSDAIAQLQERAAAHAACASAQQPRARQPEARLKRDVVSPPSWRDAG